MSRFLWLVLSPFTFFLAQTEVDSTLYELPELLFLTQDLSCAEVKQLVEKHKLDDESIVAFDTDTLYAIHNSTFLGMFPLYYKAFHFFEDTLYQIDCSPRFTGDAAVLEQRFVTALNEVIGIFDNYEIDEEDGTWNYWYLYSDDTFESTHLYQVRNLPYKDNPIEVTVTHLGRFERMESEITNN